MRLASGSSYSRRPLGVGNGAGDEDMASMSRYAIVDWVYVKADVAGKVPSYDITKISEWDVVLGVPNMLKANVHCLSHAFTGSGS
jgi:hypothetical protein